MGKKQNRSKNKKEKKRKKRYIGFFAYPNEPKDRSEIIEKAILELNKNNSLNIISWTKPDRKGSRIISDIYENIHKSDFFIADISNLNLNVLFEVGLAFGERKKILLFTQGFSSNDRQKDLQDLEILSGLRIETYESSDHIVKKVSTFLEELERKQPEIDRYVENLYSSSDQLKGLFLKGLTNHDICLTALESFKKIFQIYKVDDWNEVSTQLLRWYLKEVIDSYGVVALFVDSAWDQSRKINSRFSFICGLAIALNKKVLMIGLPGFNVPFDYKEILKKPDSTKNVEEIIKEFGAELCNEMPSVSEISPKAEADLSKKSLKKNEKEIILLDINLGDSIAENEENELNNYFVETGQFRKALTVRQAIIIGNKGSGKTANFYQIRDHFKYSNAKNLICEIKPSDYKIERFLASLKRLGNEEGL